MKANAMIARESSKYVLAMQYSSKALGTCPAGEPQLPNYQFLFLPLLLLVAWLYFSAKHVLTW